MTAVTDIDTARAEEEAAAARVFADGAGPVAADDVDAVPVTSWGPAHAEHVLNAIAAGKPVRCEKPLATTAADGLRIVDAGRAHGRRLVQVGFMRRYDTGHRQLKQVIGRSAGRGSSGIAWRRAAPGRNGASRCIPFTEGHVAEGGLEPCPGI